jgi:hypothetical protein
LHEAVDSLAVKTRRNDGRHRIRRADVLSLDQGNVVELFLATMIWGYGVGLGAWRATNIIAAESKDELQPLTQKLKLLVVCGDLDHITADGDAGLRRRLQAATAKPS